MTLKIVKYFILIFVLLLQINVSAQVKTNPFEVTHTKQYLSKKKETKPKYKTKKTVVKPKKEVVVTKNTIEVKITDEIVKLPSIGDDNNPFQVNKTQTENATTIQTQDKVEIVENKITEENKDLSIALSPIDSVKQEENISPILLAQDKKNPFSVSKGIPKTSKSTGNKKTENNKIDVNKNVEVKKVENTTPSTNPISKYFSSKNETPQKNSTFVFWILFFTVFLFAILINYKRSFILKSYRGILNENYLKLIKREENEGFSFFFLSLYFVFILSLTTFIYMILIKVMNIEVSFLQFIYFFIAILAVYVVRLLVMRSIGYIFHLEQSTSKFFFIIIYYNILLGIGLIAINIAFAFGSETVVQYSYNIGLFLIGALLLIRNIRGLLLSIQHKFLVQVQFIFYLCAVEIAPTLISIKFLSNFV